MGPILSSLVHLQTVEVKLRQAREKLRRSQRAMAKQQQRIDQAQATLAAKHEEIKLTRLQSGRLELDLKTREDQVAKLRVALNTAKTNKDYSAILTQINTSKASKSKLEDSVLALMTQVDNDQAQCRQIEQDILAEQQRLEDIRKLAQQKQQAVQVDIDRLSAEHAEAISHVPPKEQDMFERLASRFDGEVLATVVVTNGRRKEHSCGGCNMSIPLERVNALMTRDEVATCSSCGRMLMLDSQMADA